ncbi:hypothetical protein [Pseudomonas fluorescens]|uniref:Uncharacterized protein n=1 Tax=Pseudomonas fluorescens TaxID=294 RepID=A0A5E7Q7L3_PSEFL|nr:hypothetical protein [Pseudomonas fluorescens]VVP58192.1 hypothetical protein PS880_05891 [Pseudomonas fluorescens]
MVGAPIIILTDDGRPLFIEKYSRLISSKTITPMNIKTTLSILTIGATLSGCPFDSVSPPPKEAINNRILANSLEHAAKEAKENRAFANTLRVRAHQACSEQNWPEQKAIMQAMNDRLREQSRDHQKNKANPAYPSCREMLEDIFIINGSCIDSAPTQYQIDYAQSEWEEDSLNCDAEISPPKLTDEQSHIPSL